ncbi:MAG: hypothetical protein ACON3Z_08440 [Bradymonadia bacterium]
MEIQCSACGQPQTSAQCVVKNGQFVLPCAACGHEVVIGPVPTREDHSGREDVAAAQTASAEPALAEPAELKESRRATGLECPKCRWPKDGWQRPCPRCGLDPSVADPDKLDAWSNPLANHPLEDELRRQWAEVSQDWSDEAAHKQFIALCAAQRLLTYAGACYRDALASDPYNEKAHEYRQKVIQAALAEAGRFDEKFDRIRETSKRGLSTLMTGALLILVFAIAYYIITKSHHAWQFDR